jgi:hypothetical protein
MVEGMYNFSLDFYFYENCVYGKKNRVRLFSSAMKTERILHLVHNDVFRPMLVPSLVKYLYYVSFIDEFLRNTWIYFLRNKYEVFDMFKEFKDLMENQEEKQIKVLRTDNGGELDTEMNLNNFVRRVVYQGRILLHIHIDIMELHKG